jgi:DNA-binding PucR family transcriptional regulator
VLPAKHREREEDGPVRLPPASTTAGVPLRTLVRVLNQAFVHTVTAPAGSDVRIGSVVLVDGDDLADPVFTVAGGADLWMLAGVPAEVAVAWLDGLAATPVEGRPRAVMSKLGSSPALEAASGRSGTALVAVHPHARWESLLWTVRGVLDHALDDADTSSLERGAGADTDLFGLAQTVAALTRGMVSIEDDRAHVLAYSASDDAADELRRLSILGRQGPPEYLRRLDERGVYDRLRRGDDVLEVAADEQLGIRRRLVVGIHAITGEVLLAAGRPRPRPLGSIWLQEGAEQLAGDSPSVLQGAAAVAARLIARAANAPSTEAVQIQRLLGTQGGGVDVPSLAAALSIPTSGPAVVVGLAADGSAPDGVAQLAAALRLHASAFARESLVTAVDERIYVLFPHVLSAPAVSRWTTQAMQRLASRGASGLRAAVAAPVQRLGDVPTARAEVDRVLHGTRGQQGVTTLADSRTPVLLGEILDLVAGEPALKDPRLDALLAYDEQHGTALTTSAVCYLRHFGDVRAAAVELQIHPNTLRYRLRRAEQLLGLDLGDPAARLLVEIQLAVRTREQS